jgi:hypothetical protein
MKTTNGGNVQIFFRRLTVDAEGSNSMTTDTSTRKQHIQTILDQLPDEALGDVLTFLEFLQYKKQQKLSEKPRYTPVVMEGLWANVHIRDEDIAEVREEMWGSLGKKDL